MSPASRCRLAELRVLSGREARSILASQGLIAVRRQGSHVAMQKKGEDGANIVPVPDHAGLRVDVPLSIIRQSGLPRSEFE